MIFESRIKPGQMDLQPINMILPMQDNTVFNNKLCLFTFRLQYKEYCHKIEEKIHFNCPSPIVSLVNTDVMS